MTAPGPLARRLAEVEAERDAALAEVERLRKARLVAAIFGSTSGGPRPFSLYRDEIVAFGVRFPDGVVTLRFVGKEMATLTSPTLDHAVTEYAPGAQVVWLSEDLGTLAEMEERAEAAEARAIRYAEGLVHVVHDVPGHGATCQPDKWVTCEAAAWLAERAP